jgi:Ferric iron reductase FhuF-like transporter
MTESVAQYPVPLYAPSPDEATDGWFPATDLINGIASLEALFELPERLWAVSAHAAAALAWKKYTRRLAEPVAAAWTTAREIPLLSADNVLIRLVPAKPLVEIGLLRATRAVLPDSPAAGSRDAIVLPDEASLLAFLGSTLIDQHLRPLFDRTMRIRRVGARTLWGQVAAGFAAGFRDMAADDDSACAAAASAAAADTARFTALLPMRDLAGIGPDGTVWRNTCCFSRTSPSLNACRNCVTVVRRAERASSAAG